jgi:hypothetical protein
MIMIQVPVYFPFPLFYSLVSDHMYSSIASRQMPIAKTYFTARIRWIKASDDEYSSLNLVKGCIEASSWFGRKLRVKKHTKGDTNKCAFDLSTMGFTCLVLTHHNHNQNRFKDSFNHDGERQSLRAD